MPLDPNLIGAAPGDIQQTRNSGIAMYEPEENAIKARIQADKDRTDQFTQLVETAAKFGDSYAKSLPLDPNTAQAYLMQLANGDVPSEAIYDKLAKAVSPEELMKA
jgi:hypothetical protein